MTSNDEGLTALVRQLCEALDHFCRIVKSDALLAMDPDLADAVASANEVICAAALKARAKPEQSI